MTHHHLRAEQVVDWATRGGARALGMDSAVGALTPGRQADVVLLKNDASPAMTPILNPYGHVVFQAQRGDVHTVLVGGRVVKQDGRLVGADLATARSKVARHGRLPARDDGRRSLAAGHEPGDPRGAHPAQPLPVHQVTCRSEPVEA